jgi:methylenetetrahydrofolate reductase (NADPH)
MPNILRQWLKDGRFLCSAELVLGRDHTTAEAEQFVRDAAAEPGGIRIVSLTDLPSGNPALPPEAFASFVSSQGLTPLAHLSGKDGNRSLLEGRLHTLARLGVENILALTGDAQSSGFEGRAKPVYDLDSVLLLRLIEALREGIAYSLGKKTARSTPFDFFAGAVVSPYKVREADQMMQLYKLELKIAAGARFIITQLGFNLRKLYELKQYMDREGLDHIPVLADVYVPTATVARMMQAGKIAGCAVTDELIRRLESETKPERLERAALMVAAARALGFAGAHVGGFGISHGDVMRIVARSAEIGTDWKQRLDELLFEIPGEYYLYPRGSDGLSTGESQLRAAGTRPPRSLTQRVSKSFHDLVIRPGSAGARFLAARLKGGGLENHSWRQGAWYRLTGLSGIYRKATLGCMSCGDCIQDHLNYAGCTMHSCYKNLRNGPCGGSRTSGACEADAATPCIWNDVYWRTLAAGEDPHKFAHTLVPPRDWSLDRTNALANRLAGIDNFTRRRELPMSGSRR